jgi:uncharacterized membrane protein
VTDERLEKMVGTLLRTGVLLSAAIVLAGAVWLLRDSGASLPAYRQFRGEPPELRSLGAIVSSLGRPTPESLIQLGLLVLIATPVARVIFSLIAFVLERDRTYVGITAVVVVILAYSLAFAGQ